MKITGLRFGGIGTFAGDVTVPIAELGDARLIGVVGNNGAGKSTLLEAIPGALYRTTPSRGALAALAVRKDSFVEVDLEVGGVALTARLLIDGVARGRPSEGYLLADGKAVTSGKVRDYDAEIARRLPPLSVYLASAFAAQGGGGRFLSMPPADRKELFADLLGLEDLQVLSTAAGERARAAELSATELRARAETLRGLAAGERGAAEAVGRAAGAETLAREALATAEAAANERSAAMDAWRARAADLDVAVAEDAAKLRAALIARDRAAEDLKRAENRLAKVAAEHAGLAGRPGQRAELETAAGAAGDAATRVAEIEADIKARREAYEAAVATREGWLRRSHELERARDQARSVLEATNLAAAGLTDVPCGGEGAFATCGLISQATRARDYLGARREAAEAAEAAVVALGSPPVVQVDRGAWELLDAERKGLAARIAAADTARVQLEALARDEERVAVLEREATEIRGGLDGLRFASKQTAAEASWAAAAHNETTQHQAKHRDTKPAAPDENKVSVANYAVQDAVRELARAREVLDAAERASEELAGVEESVAAAVAELDDWRELQRALGRDGVQALEIDAAGPEVSDLCNELLHACYGSRFSVSLETTALRADGKGTKEVFDLRVIDTERGTDGSADHLSGGEQVLVSEALSLAICIYNARRSNVPILDLVRDECAGALSHDNATRYVEMLRRALDLGGFARCYYVAHQPHLWDLADARLLVEGGAVRIADGANIVVNAREQDDDEGGASPIEQALVQAAGGAA